MALSAATKDFARRLFDTVREMSADVRGVTRQGYGPVETKVLEFLKDEGRKLGLEIETDAAGNVWMTMKGRDSTRPAFVAGRWAAVVRSCVMDTWIWRTPSCRARSRAGPVKRNSGLPVGVGRISM